MPSVEDALFSLMTTGSPNAVAAFVGPRVHPDELPQTVTYPAIRYARISTQRSQYRALDGVAGYATVRMQVDCYALTRAQALAIAQAVRLMLEGFTGTVAGLRLDVVSTEDEGASSEPGIGPGGATVRGQRLDFFISHPED